MQVKRFTTSTASLSVKAMCRAVSSYSIFITSFFLVSDADQVVTKLLDGVGGGAGLDSLGIVGDEDGLGGLDDDNTLTALLAVQTPLVGLQHDELLAGDVEATALDLLDTVRITLVLVCIDNLRHLLGINGEARRSSPDTVALGIEDGGLVNVAGADEAGVNVCLPRHGCGCG